MIATSGPQFLPMQFEQDAYEQRQQIPEDSAFQRHGLEKHLISVLLDLNQLSARFSMNFHSTSTDDGLVVLVWLSSVLQRLLLLPTASTLRHKADISESCRYAGALHGLFPLMAHYPDPTLMVNALVHKLKESLMYYLNIPDTTNPVLLWCLAVGGVSAYQMPERNWFVGQLVVAAEELDIRSWHEMRISLTEVMSYAVFCNDSFRSLWDEVVVRATY